MKIINKISSNSLFCCIVLILCLNVFCPQNVLAQDKITATGLVVDPSGVPIVGVGITIKGSPAGTITGSDGKFSLKTSAKSIVVLSFLGYVSQELPAISLKNTTITMKEKTLDMDEVVVVGYGTQKKETLTGAIAQVSAKEILQSPVPNMGAALAGRAPGLTTYQYSGQPGEDDVIIRIRGNGTLDGSSNSAEPLILVDGVERDFTQLDPNEIQSFSILKDAASTAVFGIRGANGVIVITTKQGAEGPAKVSFSANYALQQPTRLQTNLDAMTYVKRYNQAWLNDGHPEPFFTKEDITLFQDGSDPLGHANHNWKEELVNKYALQKQYNFNVSGGTKNTNYYLSVGYMGQDGILKDYKGKIENRDLSSDFFYNRLNIRSNVTVDVTPTTKIGIQIGSIIGNKQATNNPTQTFQDIVYAAPMAGLFLYKNKLVTLARYGDLKQSPLSYFLTDIIETNTNTINSNINFIQKLDFIAKGLLIRGMVSYDSGFNQTIDTSNPNSKVFYLVMNTDPLVLEQDGEYGILSTPSSSFSRSQSTHSEIALDYKKKLGNHNVSGLFLGTLDKKWWHGKSYPTIPISYMGLVGRFTYDYKMRYLIEFNMGYNGSENFPKSNRFAFFPALSVGWNVADEPFIKKHIDENILSKLKLRASYGIVGNDASGSSRFMYLNGSYASAGGVFYMGSTNPTTYSGYKEGIIGNPNIRWETATKQNYGVDMTLFKNSLSLAADFFYDDRKDILAKTSTDPTHLALTGQDVYNIGRVKNHGYELEANWTKRYRDFSYWMGASYSFARNEVIEDGSIQDPNNPQLWRRGRSTGLSWIYVADGFFDTNEEIQQGPTLGSPTPGDVKLVDVNGDGEVNSSDVIPTKYPEIPEVTFSFKAGFSYKNFSLSCLFQGATHSTKILTGYYKTFNLPYPDNENWAIGNEENAVRPKLSLANTYYQNTANSTIWIQDGSYLKLRNVEIQYTVNQKFIKKALHLDNLSFYLNGQNLLSFDKLKYVDPEMKTDAATFGSFGYPQMRVFNLGLKLNF